MDTGLSADCADTGTVVTPQEFLYLKRRVEKLENMVQVLETVDCTISSPLQEKLKVLESLCGQFSVYTFAPRQSKSIKMGKGKNYIADITSPRRI